MRAYWLPFLALLAVPLVGCGGGGGTGPSADTTGDSSINLGALSVSYTRAASNLKPAVSSQNAGALVTGIAGANFTKILLNSNKDLSNTLIAARHYNDMYVMNPDGSNAHKVGVSNQYSNQSQISWHPGGGMFAYIKSGGGQVAPARMNQDGTGLITLTPDADIFYGPAWTNVGNKIAYTATISSKDQIRVVSAGGGTPTTVSDGTTNDFAPQWSADGSKIYFERQISTSYFMYVMNANGSGVTSLPGGFASSNPFTFSFSPDGTYYTFDGNGPGISLGSNGGYGPLPSPPSGYTDRQPSFLPDNQTIVFTRVPPSGNSYLCTINANGSGLTQITDGTLAFANPAWSPYPGPRVLAGAGGAYGNTSSGFLVGQLGAKTESFLSFAVTTPSTAAITLQSPSGNVSNSAFELSGDTITALRYSNDFQVPPVTIVPTSSFPTAKGALIEYDAASGQVVLIIPFNSSKRAASKMGSKIYTGQFLGIFDAKGKNLAPSGASQVEISASGGKLLSYR